MRILVDAGPLVAYLNRRDQHHAWAVRQTAELASPLYTCEAVLTEAHYLVASPSPNAERLLGLIESGVIDVSFSYAEHIARVNALMRTYENVPMSFADACLVRMAELHGECRIFTTDGDFRIYRKHRRERLDVLMP